MGRSDWKCKSSLFYFLFDLLNIVFWKLVLLISATTLTSGIFIHTPTNVSLTLSVAVWVWTLPLKGRKSCVKKCRTHKCPASYRNFTRATFLFVLLFIYLFIYYIYFFFFSERLLSATFTWIIISFCLTFSGWDTWSVTVQASNLKQTLTINNIFTMFLLKSRSSNTIQAFNIFDRY